MQGGKGNGGHNRRHGRGVGNSPEISYKSEVWWLGCRVGGLLMVVVGGRMSTKNNLWEFVLIHENQLFRAIE